MKTRLLRKTMLLLCALVAGSSSMWADDTYVKVTQESDLTIGGTYIFVTTHDETNYLATGDYAKRLNTTSSEFTISADGNTVTISTATPFNVVLGGEEDAYTLKMANGSFLGKGASNTEFASNASSASTISQYTWNFKDGTFYSNYYDTGSKGKDHRDRYIGFNYNKGTPYFGPYNNTSSYELAVRYKKVTTATLATSGYTTLVSSYPLNLEDVTGLDAAFVVSDATASAATLTEVTAIPANTGVILKGTANAELSIPVATYTGEAITNLLEGSATEAAAVSANSVYVVSGGQFKLFTGTEIVAGKAYLPKPADARELLSFDFGDATAIDAIANSEELISNGEFYDLQGRRVAHPTKGIYIVNGKKVVIK